MGVTHVLLSAGNVLRRRLRIRTGRNCHEARRICAGHRPDLACRFLSSAAGRPSAELLSRPRNRPGAYPPEARPGLRRRRRGAAGGGLVARARSRPTSTRWPTVAALLVLLPVLGACWQCVYQPFDFHPEKNDGVVVDALVDAGSSCTHNFGEGPGYKFTGITFHAQAGARHAGETTAHRFIYTPDPGFKGKDPTCSRSAPPKARKGLLDGGVCGGGEERNAMNSSREF